MPKILIRVLSVIVSLVTFGAVVSSPSFASGSGAPAKARIISIVETDESLSVTWRPGSGIKASSYQAIAVSEDSEVACNPTKKNKCTITGLQNDVEYQVYVMASNSSGNSYSNSVYATPAMATIRITGKLVGKTLTDSNGNSCAAFGVATGEDANPDCTLRVMAVTEQGRMFVSDYADGDTKSFSLTLRTSVSQRASASLHLLRGNGAYVGPILLSARGGVQLLTNSVVDQVIKLATTSLKSANGVTGFAVSAPSKSLITGTALKLDKKGAPLGAGKSGFVAVETGNGLSRIANKSKIFTQDLNRRVLPQDAMCTNFIGEGIDGTGLLDQACFNSIVMMLSGFEEEMPGITDMFVAACETSIGKTFIQVVLANGSCWEFLQMMGADVGCIFSSPGADGDGDGLPNAIDPDDDGDLVLDFEDSDTNAECTIEPSKSIRSSMYSPLNYMMTEAGWSGDVNDAINEKLNSDLDISYYSYSDRFFPNAYKENFDGHDLIPAVWITCDGVLWCDPATSAATLSDAVDLRSSDGSEAYQFTELWKNYEYPLRFWDSYSGGQCNDNRIIDYTPDLPTGLSNFLWEAFCVDGDGGRGRSVIGAFIRPNIGDIGGKDSYTYAFDEAISPMDVIMLNYLAKDGSVAQIATTLGMWPVTSPLIREINGTVLNYGDELPFGVSGNSVVLSDSNQLLVVEFNRPQRLAFDGESADSGLHDVFGLNYGVELTLGNLLLPCGESSYDNTHGTLPDGSLQYDLTNAVVGTGDYQWLLNASTDTGAQALAPIKDPVRDSFSYRPSDDRQLRISLNLVQCLLERESWLNEYGYNLEDLELPSDAAQDGTETGWMSSDVSDNIAHGDHSCFLVSLRARGEAKTGGTDNSSQDFCIQFAYGTFSSRG